MKDKTLKDKEKKEFLWDLYYLIDGKVPLGEAIEIIMGQKNSNKGFYGKILANIQEGSSLSQSLKAAGFQDRYILKVMEAGEQGDFLETAILDLCNLMDEKTNLKSKIVNSLIYPTILLFFAILTIIFTFTYVVPSVLNIYNVLGIEKSSILNLFLNVNLGAILLALLGIIIIYIYINYRRGKTQKLLIIGPIINNLDKFLFYKMLSNLLKGGVPLYQSMEIVKEFPRTGGGDLNNILRGIFKGQPLHSALQQSGFDTSMPINFIRIAEESGDIHQGVTRVETFYKRSLDNSLMHFGKVFEPIIIAVVGVTVVIVVLSLLLPIYQLFQGM